MTTLANAEIEIFGKTTKVNNDGFFIAPNGEPFKAFIPRSLVKGRRVNMAQMLQAVRDMFQDGLTGSQIAKLLDMDSDTIGRYRKYIIAFNALDETAIVKQRENQAEFRNEQTAQMLARPDVKEWYDTLIENGKTRKIVKMWAASINRACKILKISPITLCQKEYAGTRQQLNEINSLMFAVKQEITSESSFYIVRMAVRSWLQYNDVTIPRGNLCPKNLSGKVVSTHGQAAHVRASLDEIAQANAILENPKSKLPYPERRIDTEVYFKFGVETASRSTAILTTKIGFQ